MSLSMTQEVEKNPSDATCDEEKPLIESELNQEESSVREQQTTNHITLVKSHRGSTLLAIGNQKYKRTNRLANIDKTYWICVEPNCLARVVTLKRRIKHTYGLHTCKSNIRQPQELDTTCCEENDRSHSTDKCCSYVTDNRGNKLLAVGNHRYKLTRNLPTIKKAYWLCARPACPARAVTISDRLESTTGSHVCQSSGPGDENSADTGLKFTVGMRGTSKILVLDERSYRCKYSTASTNRAYWECVRASSGCPAKLITIAGRLASITNSVHTCTATAETVKNDAKLDGQEPGAKRKKPTAEPHHIDDPEKPPPSKKRKILRQSKKLASRSLPVQTETAKVVEETVATISGEIIDEREARVMIKARRVKRVKRTTRQTRVERVNSTPTETYTNFEQVKRMAHLQPRVVVARFLTTVIEKLSERASLANKMSAQVDNTLAQNTVSIANLSLN